MKNYFQDNIFYKRLIKDVEPAVKKNLKARVEKKKYKFTKRQIFIGDTLVLIGEIENKLKDLEVCLTFINSYPNIKTWRKVYTRAEYITYHLEYYYINIAGVYDRILKLVNHLFNLGKIDRHVSHELIINNSLVDKKIISFLKRFHKGFSGVRTIQNSIKHKEKYAFDKVLNDIRYHEGVKKISEDANNLSKEEIENWNLLLKLDYFDFLPKKKKEIKNNNDAIIKACDLLLELCFSQYKKRLVELSTKK